MKRIIPLLCAAALVTAGAVAAQPGHHFRGGFDRAGGPEAGMSQRGSERLTKALGLTQAQQASAQQLRDRLKETVQPLFDAARQKHDAIREGLDNNADAATLGNLMIETHRIGSQIRAAHDQYERDFAALLTPEQATKYNTIREMREQFRHDSGEGVRPSPVQ